MGITFIFQSCQDKLRWFFTVDIGMLKQIFRFEFRHSGMKNIGAIQFIDIQIIIVHFIGFSILCKMIQVIYTFFPQFPRIIINEFNQVFGMSILIDIKIQFSFFLVVG